MLNDKLVKFCDDNFDDGKSILTKLTEYKVFLIGEYRDANGNSRLFSDNLVK